MTIGYNKPLYILPFDHRSSFAKGLFGWKGPLTQEQTERIVQSKAVIYDAFRLSLAKGVSKEHTVSLSTRSSAPPFFAMRMRTDI